MWQKQCRLTIADKFYGPGGGGGGATVVRRNVSQEWPKIRSWERRWTENIYPRFTRREPIVSGLYGMAKKFMGEPTSPLLKEMQSQALEDVERRGALSPEEEGRVRAATLATAGEMGMGWTPGTLGTELLNREQYRQQREATARGFATGVEGLTEASRAQGFQLPESVLQTGTQAFGSLTNPILDYLNRAFTPQVVGQPAGDNKGSAAIGAGGSIIGAAIPAIVGL
jgi:hypothetical protein